MADLPPVGEDVKKVQQLWPTAQDGLFGLEHEILATRLNTLLDIMQEQRIEIASLKKDVQELKAAREPTKKRVNPEDCVRANMHPFVDIVYLRYPAEPAWSPVN